MGSSSTVEFDHQKSFRIKHDDDKFLSRLLSKETSKSNPSFRVYYGDHVPSAVPFMWETRPGTPKHTSSDNSYNIPPLTPPPSYYTNNNFTNSTSNKYYSRSKLLFNTFLRTMNPKKPHSSASSHSPTSSSSFSSLSWSSSSRSSFSDPVMTPTYVHKRRRTSSWSYSFDKSCFGIDKEMINGERVQVQVQVQLQRGCSVKKAFLSIVGRRSA